MSFKSDKMAQLNAMFKEKLFLIMKFLDFKYIYIYIYTRELRHMS